MLRFEDLIDKSVIFKDSGIKHGSIYYDAKVKIVHGMLFIKYNKPDIEIFDRNESVEGRKKTKEIVFKRILQDMQNKKVKDNYKYSIPANDEIWRFDCFCLFNKKNVFDLLFKMGEQGDGRRKK